MTIDQAGSTMIVHEQALPGRLVAVKRVRPVNGTSVLHLRPYKSDQVVSIFDTYVDGPDIMVVYEAMDISLRQMVSVCPIQVAKVAAIFKEVVYGLDYLHQKLSLVHGFLSCDSILLRQDGATKIANVGEAFLSQIPYTRENRRKDIRSLGGAIVESIEPETFILEADTLILRNDEQRSLVKTFLLATESVSLEELKKHPFLSEAVQKSSLTSDIFRAVRVVGISWDGIISA